MSIVNEIAFLGEIRNMQPPRGRKIQDQVGNVGYSVVVSGVWVGLSFLFLITSSLVCSIEKVSHSSTNIVVSMWDLLVDCVCLADGKSHVCPCVAFTSTSPINDIPLGSPNRCVTSS